jgi:hypothetical protein
MLRPRAWIHAIAPLSLVALGVLSGCTIEYVEPAPAPGRRRAARAPRQTNPAPSSGTSGGGSGGSTDTDSSSSAAATPRITAPIIFGNGTAGAFRGRAYVIPETTRTVPDFDKLVPFATLFTDSFNISPQTFSGGFPGVLKQDDWFGIRYEGTFFVPNDGSFTFEVTSDDGAILYIDGQRVVDNDGVHSPVTSSGRKELRSGNHRLRLDYFQSTRGQVALGVFVIQSGQKVPLVGVRTR